MNTTPGIKRLEQICRQKGTPLTNQRRAVLEVLLQRTDHPTADQVHEAVQGRIPRTSRRTVYRVLEMLVALGLARRVHHPGADTRFDARMERHHHLVCIRCNRVVDFEGFRFDGIALPRGKPHGFEISDVSVQLLGTCPACRKEKRKPRKEKTHE